MRTDFARCASLVADADFTDFFAGEAVAFFLATWDDFAVAANASAGATVAVAASKATATDTAVPSVMLCNILRGENDSAFIRVWTKRREFPQV